jgi:WD40 repeat protein
MVVGSEVRHLAVSNNKAIFLAALFDKTVFVWSAINGQQIAKYETVMDYGGNRIALANSKDVFVAGAYDRFGIVCYRLYTGDILWHRKDLKGVQDIKISPDDKVVFCGFLDKSGHILDLDTGGTVKTLRGVRNIFYDVYESCTFYDFDAPKRYEIVDAIGNRRMVVNRLSFALLDAVFSPKYIGLAESGGPVRFISRKDPDKTIYYHPPKGEHILRIAYSSNNDVFYGIQWKYKEYGSSILLKFDLSADQPYVIADIGKGPESQFCDFGDHLITSHGHYVNTTTGAVEKNLEFPLSED